MSSLACFKTLMRILTRLEFTLDLCPIFKLVVRSIGTFSKDLAMPVRHIVLISFLKHLHQRIHNLKAFGSAHLTNLFNYISHTCTYYNKKTSNPADDMVIQFGGTSTTIRSVSAWFDCRFSLNTWQLLMPSVAMNTNAGVRASIIAPMMLPLPRRVRTSSQYA